MLKLFLFAIVGTIGFAVDTFFLYLCKEAFGLYIARLISFFMAVIVTWLLNRQLTFKKEAAKENKGKEFFSYFAFMLIGGVLNYMAYSVSIHFSPFISSYPVIAVAIGSICGLLVNFTTSLLFIFNKKKPL